MNNDLLSLRLQLLARGWHILPNHGKGCLRPGWNTPQFLKEEINPAGARRWARSRRDLTTGLRVEGGLVVVDIDVDDELAEQVYQAIERIAPDFAARAPLRYGHSPHKMALFGRLSLRETDTPFARWASGRYLSPEQAAIASADPGADIKGHLVEVFGGRPTSGGNCSKQFAIYGPHPDGGEYAWAEGPRLTEVSLGDLPELGVEAIGKILDAWKSLAAATGWTLAEPERLTADNDAVFDITDETRFDVQGGGSIGYADLVPGMRCSSSFFDPHSGGNRSKCWAMESSQGLAVYDHKTLTTHYHERSKPVDTDVLGAELGALAEDLGIEIQAPAGMPPRAGISDFYAFLPTHQYIYKHTGALWPMASINSVL